ncbi:portal protein [Erwinia phage pEa_SNUABM_2]|uniref:Portal protein n=1 Tax=Erwinia phage pEa_SNUABM_2 TaxID=2869547 RepID=A0AAE7XPF2_9CAUD|nr:portal protein [Erwinia phage pEa_SNUABM_2]QZE59250.1 hypothetical protein pEaSNUABM2_00006 [Erwinia phage pEa_SNUABM_2]QZE59586.1 hypothetical protein pEaSNUABM39_00006 [Erwinia phage pEa_SNUABM_39]
MGVQVGRRQLGGAPSEPAKKKETSLGAASLPREIGKAIRSESSKRSMNFTSQSAGGAGMAAGNMQIGSVPLDIDLEPMMEGMDYDADDRQLFNVYRDMYHFDPICGSYVDLFSTLPFSDVSFSGAKDSVLEPYYEVNERLSLTTSMPNITTDIQVTGAFVGSMIYNKDRKKFIDLMTHRYDNIDVTPLPFISQDPMFELRIPQYVKSAFAKEGKRIDALKKELGPGFVDKLMNDTTMELDPIGTIYIPRKTFSFGEGISVLRRVLPIWLIEKNLYRGTLIESGRRQRGILHAQLGDGDQWEPSQEEMDFMTDLLLSADSDPIGSIITTRLGVNISEFRQGGDFWKITDIWDQTAQFKMRAMGISEAFLSGEANYDSGAAGLTIFVEAMRAFRDHLTRKVYYEKVFPLISMMNGLAVQRNGKIIKKNNMMEGGLTEVMYKMNDGSKLFIPNVHWSKQLRPDVDQAMMENLRAMTELGVPVPLRAIAAAGGYNFDQILMDQDEDLAMRRKLMAYRKRQSEIDAEFAPPEPGAGDGDSFSSVSSMSADLQRRRRHVAGIGLSSAVLGGEQRKLLNRDFGERSEIFELSKTGKKKHVFRQSVANSKANDQIWKAAKNYEANKTMPLDDGKVSFKPTPGELRAMSRLR